jgi:hypothetical protein
MKYFYYIKYFDYYHSDYKCSCVSFSNREDFLIYMKHNPTYVAVPNSCIMKIYGSIGWKDLRKWPL